MSPRKASDLTATDQFCGGGGSTTGARQAGLRVRTAVNHWKLAVETYGKNHPEVDVDCADTSNVHPARYPSTDILISSPECTTHSPAGGSRRLQPQRDFFDPKEQDPSVIRSRATMFDVVRFAEFHLYHLIVVENVVEVLRWLLFPDWLKMMTHLGYAYRIVSLNSMFAHPTPQSRDRVYIVFWRKGNPAPDLDIRPPAYCAACDIVVEARQTWKANRRVGKYRQQYIYTCPRCRQAIAPYYYAALNALDLSLSAERIGDRSRPLRPRTLDRIRVGLDRYGRRPLLLTTNQTTDHGRVRTVLDPAFTQTSSSLTALLEPSGFLVETAYSHSPGARMRGLGDAMMTQGTQRSAALVALPFIVNGHMSRRVYPTTDPLSTQSASREHDGVVIPPAAIIPQRNHNVPRSLADPLPVVCTGGHHMLVHGAALLTLRDSQGVGYLLRGLDQPLGTQVATCAQDALISPAPFIVSYYGNNLASGADEPVPVVTTVDRHGVVAPDDELRVEDCYFRMLQPHEIGAAMAFPRDYVVLGTKRDQVRQYGNAVTPPAMEILLARAIQSLTGERVA